MYIQLAEAICLNPLFCSALSPSIHNCLAWQQPTYLDLFSQDLLAPSLLLLCSIDSYPLPTPPPEKPTLPTTSFSLMAGLQLLASNRSCLISPPLQCPRNDWPGLSHIRISTRPRDFLCRDLFCIGCVHWSVAQTWCLLIPAVMQADVWKIRVKNSTEVS